MALKKRKGITVMMLGIMIIGAIIGTVILDVIIADARVPGTVFDESFVNATAIEKSGDVYKITGQRRYQLGSTVLTNSTGVAYTLGTNYTELNNTHINVTSVGNISRVGSTFLLDYDYPDGVFFESALSRTIANFIVPLALLAILGGAALA